MGVCILQCRGYVGVCIPECVYVCVEMGVFVCMGNRGGCAHTHVWTVCK